MITIKENLPEQLLLARALERAANPILLLDRGGRVAWANAGYAQQIEGPMPATPGLPMTKFSDQMQLALGKGYRVVWRQLYDGEVWSGIVEFAPCGGQQIFECVISPLPDAQGRPAYFLVVMHDITRHHREMLTQTYRAHHDHLTGLANRVQLARFSDQLIMEKQSFSVLYMDLDRFKTVNDTLGHQKGDEVLQRFANQISKASRVNDLAVRLGGDEFVLVLAGCPLQSVIQRIAEGIITAAPACFDEISSGLSEVLGVSVGGAVYPHHGSSMTEVLAAADKALYQAKERGKGCFVLAEAIVDERAKQECPT